MSVIMVNDKTEKDVKIMELEFKLSESRKMFTEQVLVNEKLNETIAELHKKLFHLNSKLSRAERE